MIVSPSLYLRASCIFFFDLLTHVLFPGKFVLKWKTKLSLKFYLRPLMVICKVWNPSHDRRRSDIVPSLWGPLPPYLWWHSRARFPVVPAPAMPCLHTAWWLVEGITVFMSFTLNQGLLGNVLFLILSSEATLVNVHCQLDCLADTPPVRRFSERKQQD